MLFRSWDGRQAIRRIAGLALAAINDLLRPLLAVVELQVLQLAAALFGLSVLGLLEAIARRINHKTFELPNEQGRFKVYPGTYCIPPVLVWKPCRESWSPHLPFYQIVVGPHVLYVRLDGQVFTQLTSGRGV